MQSGNEILPVYAILQKKKKKLWTKYMKNLAWKLVPGSF